MAKRLFIKPPSLYVWMRKNKQSQIIFLDLEPDYPDDRTLRLELNVIFRPMAVRIGRFQTVDYYVGSTGARVIFETTGGKITEHREGCPLPVNYEMTYTRKRQAVAKIAPKFENEAVGSLEVGEVTFDKDVTREFKTKFSGSEKMLADVKWENGVEWEIAGPEKGAIRDYFIGNLYLHVVSSWNSARRQGRIVLRPSDVIFFDGERRRIGHGPKAIMMSYVLWDRDINISREPVTILFEGTV